MRTSGIAGLLQVEEQVPDRKGGDGDHLEPGPLTDPRYRGGGNVLEGVSGAIEEKIELGVGIPGEQEDHSPDLRLPEEEPWRCGQFEQAPRVATDPPVGPASHGCLGKAGGRERGVGDALQQVGREDLDMLNQVVHLLAVGPVKGEDDALEALGLDVAHMAQRLGHLGGHGRIAEATEAEGHIAGGDRPPIVPPGPRVEIEGDGEGVAPGPGPGQPRFESGVAARGE